MKPCIHCGYCCRKGPCPFGRWDAARQQCAYLTPANLCGIYHEIIGQPGADMSPAFGTGCCSPMNSERSKCK